MLADVWGDARARWPTIDVGFEAFEAYLRDRPGGNTSDLYLACACAAGDPRAIEAFESYCMTGLDRTLARLGLGADAIAEVKQRVRCLVLVGDGRPGRITEFTARGTLPAWVRVVAANEARHMARKFRREIGADDLERFHTFVTPEPREAMTGPYRSAFATAFDRALRSLADRDQVMLRQHVVGGLSVDELGTMYGVHRATAARTLERVRRTLRTATKARMRVDLDAGSTEVSSIIRSIRGRVAISLRGLRRRLP